MREFLTVGEAERHARNVKACDALLEALRHHHSDDVPAPVDCKHKSVVPKKIEPRNIARDIIRVSDAAVGSLISIKRIKEAVARHYNIRILDLSSARRAVPIVRPRQIAMWLCRTHTEWSLPMIGRHFGGRDHSTILHGCRLIDQLIRDNERIRADVNSIERELGIYNNEAA